MSRCYELLLTQNTQKKSQDILVRTFYGCQFQSNNQIDTFQFNCQGERACIQNCEIPCQTSRATHTWGYVKSLQIINGRPVERYFSDLPLLGFYSSSPFSNPGLGLGVSTCIVNESQRWVSTNMISPFSGCITLFEYTSKLCGCMFESIDGNKSAWIHWW